MRIGQGHRPIRNPGLDKGMVAKLSKGWNGSLPPVGGKDRGSDDGHGYSRLIRLWLFGGGERRQKSAPDDLRSVSA